MRVHALSLVFLFTLCSSEILLAQSGARGGGAARASGGRSVASRSVGTRSAGSGSRSAGSGSRRSAVSPREQALIRQRQQLGFEEQTRRNQVLQQEALQQRRQDLLAELHLNPNSSQNKRQRQRAFQEAKKEYIALKRMEISLSDAQEFLTEPFQLNSKEFDRDKGALKWPKPLLDPAYEEKIAEIARGFAEDDESTLSREEIDQLLSELNRQLGERVLSRDISSVNYAHAKRFLTGLSNDGKVQ